MKDGRFYLSTVGKAIGWARANALSFFSAGSCGCWAELFETMGCRYDLERFGCLPEEDPRQADLLIVSGAITYKSAAHIRKAYNEMLDPKYVIAVGACANCGGLFAPESSYSVVPGIDRIVPVDVYVPGCPPRPEAIMNGIIALQEKIRGHERAVEKN